MANKETETNQAHPKKELRKELAAKIKIAVTNLKSVLGEKEFEHRVKKAAKILVQGLDIKELTAKNNTPVKIASPKVAAPKIKTAKKVKAKKAASAQ